jgi:ribosomal protein S18 acetylase RimI-like enzyme
MPLGAAAKRRKLPDLDSAVEFEAQMDPFDPALLFFDCGSDDTATAINAFFRTGKWATQPGMVALRFSLSGARIGYAAVRMSTLPHPDSSGHAREDYLAIWMMGVDRPFQGATDPGSIAGYHISDAVMRACESVALANGAAGMSLWVREANRRAQALYGRNGFAVDPRGVFSDRRGINMLEMRKLLRP